MSKQINKKPLIILIIIQIGYLLRGHLPAMCYYTPFLSNYTKYPAKYFFFFLDYLFLFLLFCVGIFEIKNIKMLLKIFGLVQPLKLVTDVIFSFISDSVEGLYYMYPLLNFYLLIINIIFIKTYLIEQSKMKKQFLKPAVFCAGAVIFQFLIYLIPVSIYFVIKLSQIQGGNTVINAQFPFIMLIVQFVVCNILQVLGGVLLVGYDDLTMVKFEISINKKQNLIIYLAALVGSLVLLLLYYLWLNMPNAIIEIIRFGFSMN